MDTFEEEITNEKDLISKDDIDKSNNSLAIKSLDAGAFDFIELLKEKFFLLITLKKSDNEILIKNKSILKIFELFCDKNDKENIESTLLNYIACIINEKEENNSINILDAPYVELLKRTKNYKINFNIKNNEDNPYEDMKNNLMMIYEEQNNKIDIKENSLNKICKFLGKNIFDISDYINVLVLYLNEEELNKAYIQKNIIDKYSKSGENFYFSGIKKFETELIIPEKNKKNGIYKLNSLFDKILNKIENVENISDLSEEDNNIEKNKIKIDNIPKKYIGQKYDDEINYNKNNEEENGLPRDEDNKFNCQKDICEKCIVF